MVHWYCITYSFYNNNKRIYSHCSTTLADHPPEEKELDISWDNLTELYHDYGWSFPGNIWNFKKGRVFSFWNNDVCIVSKDFQHDIKEWKDPLNLKLKISYTIHDDIKSIQDVLNYRNCDLAIRYLTERGLNIINGK